MLDSVQSRKLLEELHYLTKDAQISNRAEEMARLVPKWKKTGLLEGYNAIQQIQMAGLLQNQALVVRKTLNESTETTDIAGFNKIAFPLVKKVYDKLIAQDLVSLQTLDRPSGLVFYEDFEFETAQPGFSLSSVYQNLDTSVTGILGGRGAGTATGGFYNLKHWYTRRWFNRASLAITAIDDYNVTVPYGSLTGIGAGADESMPLFVNTIPLEFVGWNGADANYVINASLTTSTTADMGTLSSSTIYYVAKTDLTNRGDFESISAIPSIQMKIASIPVTAQSRKIKSGWTQEGAQDLVAYHGIDAEVEITTTLSDIASLEVNNNILNDLLQAGRVSGNGVYWSYKIGDYLNDSGATITGMSYSAGHIAFHGTQREWNETLVNKMSKVANTIYKKTFRGSANKAVVSPEVATLLEATLAWKTLETGPQKYSAGIEKVGTVSDKFTVFKHATFPTGKVLMVYKGDQWLDTGYVYAPFIMLYMTPVVYDPDTFEPRKMLLTRDARQTIKPEFFGIVNVQNTANI